MPDPSAGPLLGIDYGTRKLGLAIGNLLTGSARPLEPVRYREQEGLYRPIERVLEQWRPSVIVIGLPLAGDGGETEMSGGVRAFAAELERRSRIPVRLHDERLSSHAAAQNLAGRRREGRARRRDAARLDSMAAALILESWMAEHA